MPPDWRQLVNPRNPQSWGSPPSEMYVYVTASPTYFASLFWILSPCTRFDNDIIQLGSLWHRPIGIGGSLRVLVHGSPSRGSQGVTRVCPQVSRKPETARRTNRRRCRQADGGKAQAVPESGASRSEAKRNEDLGRGVSSDRYVQQYS
jgi:hypothetical protein